MLKNIKLSNKKVRMSKAHWQKLLNVFFFVMMGFGLYFIVARSGFDHFLESLRHVSFGLGLVLITLNVLVILLAGWRLGALVNTVVPGINPTSIAKINLIALASNYASIGKLNAPVKALLLKKLHEVPFSASTPIILAEQAFDFGSLIFLTIVGLLFAGPFATIALQLLSELGWNTARALNFLFVIIIIVLVVLIIVWAIRKKFTILNEMISATIKIGRNRKMMLKSIFYTVCIHLTNIATVASILYFLDLKMELGLILLLMTIPVIAGLFTPMPGGLGVREFVFASMYTLCCGAGSAAVVAALLIRLGFFISLPIAFLLTKFYKIDSV